MPWDVCDLWWPHCLPRSPLGRSSSRPISASTLSSPIRLRSSWSRASRPGHQHFSRSVSPLLLLQLSPLDNLVLRLRLPHCRLRCRFRCRLRPRRVGPGQVDWYFAIDFIITLTQGEADYLKIRALLQNSRNQSCRLHLNVNLKNRHFIVRRPPPVLSNQHPWSGSTHGGVQCSQYQFIPALPAPIFCFSCRPLSTQPTQIISFARRGLGGRPPHF